MIDSHDRGDLSSLPGRTVSIARKLSYGRYKRKRDSMDPADQTNADNFARLNEWAKKMNKAGGFSKSAGLHVPCRSLSRRHGRVTLRGCHVGCWSYVSKREVGFV